MAESFTLTIEIDSQGLTNLTSAGQQIGITSCFQIPSAQDAVWVTFAPTLTNTVTWQNDFSVYAQIGAAQVGSTLTANAKAPASGGNTYPFSGGQFQSPTSGLPLGQYAVENQQQSIITAGLARSVTANNIDSDTLPLNGDILLNGNTGFWTPLDQILVYAASSLQNSLFLDRSTLSNIESSTFVTPWSQRTLLPSPLVLIAVSTPLLVDFTSQSSQTIHYDDNVNEFVAGPLSP